LCREQRSANPNGSGSQFAATLAATAGHDGPAGARTHPQTEAMHTCTPPIVRLKCPLALGHGFLSSLHLTVATPVCHWHPRTNDGLG